MSHRSARATQVDIAGAAKMAKAQAMAVEIRRDGTILLIPITDEQRITAGSRQLACEAQMKSARVTGGRQTQMNNSARPTTAQGRVIRTRCLAVSAVSIVIVSGIRHMSGLVISEIETFAECSESAVTSAPVAIDDRIVKAWLRAIAGTITGIPGKSCTAKRDRQSASNQN